MSKIKDLIPDNKNYNSGNEFGNSLIEKSLRKLGAGRSILIDKNNRIIAGNKTIENAVAIGLEDMQIVESDGTKIIAVKRTDIDLDSKKGRELALADNASAKANIVWNHENLKEDWGDDELKGWGIEEIEPEILEAVEDDYQQPETIETDIVLGDLFEIGEHRLLCGDSTDSDAVARLMCGEKADMVFTDPPYGVSYQSNMRTKTEKFDVIKNDSTFITEWINNLPLFSVGFVFVWTSWKVLKQWMEICEPIGDLSNLVIWDKGGGGIGDLKKTFLTDFELALVYGRGAEIKGKRLGSVWSVGKDGANTYLHPTQKPVGLAALAIQNLTDSGDVVLDLFLGSGSTMVAAHQLKRRCYGMELEPKYCQVIVDRMRKLDPNIAVKRNGEIFQ